MVDHLHASVAAFWSVDRDDDWECLYEGLREYRQDRLSNLVVLNEPAQRPRGTPIKEEGLATVLGYVGTRVPGVAGEPLKAWDAIKADIDAWFTADQPADPDGIYLDELVLHDDPTKEGQPNAPHPPTEAQPIVERFNEQYPHLKLMVLAGGARYPWLVEGFTSADGDHVDPPDWVLLFENTVENYRERFAPTALPPGGTDQSDSYMVTMPAWWKDPKHRSRIAHTVHGTADTYDWQQVTDLAAARNVGHLYVMDHRGLKDGKHVAYDHLPPYWKDQCARADRYNDAVFALRDDQLIYAARQIGLTWNPRLLHAWPAFDTPRDVAGQLMRGIYGFLDTDEAREKLSLVQIPPGELTGPNRTTPPAFDVSSLWGAVHRWAEDETKHPGTRYVTAMPTCAPRGDGDPVEAVAFRIATYFARERIAPQPYPDGYTDDLRTDPPSPVPPTKVEGRPTFAEAGAVAGYVARATKKEPPEWYAAWPTFDANLNAIKGNPGGDPTGRTNRFGSTVYELVRIGCHDVDVVPELRGFDVPATEFVTHLP